MKTIAALIILFVSLNTIAQDFSGEYISNFTTYKDEPKAKNNFEEKTNFNVSILFVDEHNGMIGIQDPRIPNKILVYEVTKFLNKVEGNGNTLYIYEAVTIHLQNPMDTKVILYYNKNSELDLMISDVESSQVFHNLKKV